MRPAPTPRSAWRCACPSRCCSGSTWSGSTPAGVGLSTPVECIPDELKEDIVAAEPRPTTDEQLDEAFALAQEVADACAEEYDAAPLGTFNTVDTARDMDQLRQAVGDEQLNYLGYSYGTTLGSTYAELFPDKVRAMVLDAAVDPDTDELTHAEESAAAFEAGFDAFAANCTGLIAGCPLGAEPRQFVEALLGQAAQTPIPSSEPTATPTPAAGGRRPRGARGTRGTPAGHPGRGHDRDPGRPLRHQVVAAAGAVAGSPRSRATPRGCSRSRTPTPGGWRTAPTPTCWTRTWR